ncbi:MAG: tetratricopeptide repeat protein [Planctomycetes bacterium]|nr:tetratricopeptide repeat protein [Planctomycetota bacterium]
MNARRGQARRTVRALAPLALGLLSVLGACASPFARPGGARVVSTYDELSAALTERYAAARRAFDSGDFAGARIALADVLPAAPDHIGLGILAQEVELASGDADARDALAERTLAVLEAAPTPARCVLAARLAREPAAARALLARALELDPRCAWARYGLAHLAARAGDWTEADAELERALELDAFLPPARRLEAMLLARDGRRREAIGAFESWLEDVVDDPRVALREFVEAELDLATLYVLDQDPDAARELLTRLTLEGELAVRALCVLAAAEQGAERPNEALHATRAAEELAPDVALPWVQEAILRQSWLDDPEGAEAAWRRLLASSQTGGDLGRVLLAMRARLALERAERRRERAKGAAP